MNNSLVIIPTYNEKENIETIIREILKQDLGFHILIVDDSSPDGTSDIVLQLSKEFPNQVNLLLREKKEGLGRAYISGFKWGLERNYEYLIEMDADFSHRPIDLKKHQQAWSECDFCIGSRYVPGGETVNWGILRKIISKGGSLYSRWILGFPINDWTGGFNSWNQSVLRKIGLDRVSSNGYSFQIELKYKACKNGFKFQEVPIVFEDRRVGKSKMSMKIVLEAFYKVWQIKWL
ncbi:MAG: polyprenol monophosphomannose synthase [Deltaproteobacteria bacterium]|jgi:dolichol-phosphate mannosyltransferase|nr:polyprenol monophosphomannose synthase [Deltaproteobacteria bacterium]